MNSLVLRQLLLPALCLGTTTLASAGTIVSGHINNPAGKAVAVLLGSNPVTRQSASRVIGQLDAKGDVRLELPALTAPTEVTFAHGQEITTLFLTPGDNLRLTLDANQFDQSLRFTGTGADANTFLSQSYLKFEADPAASPFAQADKQTLPQTLAAIDARRSKRLAYLKTFAASHKLTPAFRAYARQSILFTWATNRLSLPSVVQEATGKPAVLPAGYDGFLTTMRPMQDSALAMHNSAYTSFMQAYAGERLAPGGQLPGPEAFVKTAEQQFGPSASRDLVMGMFMVNYLYDHEAPTLEPLLPAFTQAARDTALVGEVRRQFNRRMLVATGKEAPAVTVRDAAGKPVSLADYKGKVVYLDFWASWCGPCMAEVPASVALKKKFEGQDVVFLYVSIDDDEAKWKQALAKHPLTSANSVHGWTKGFDAPTPAGYQVNAIPAYFVVGRDGRLAASPAPRPSEGEAAEAALHKALGK